jgi:sugar lactone lactonase YvrE
MDRSPQCIQAANAIIGEGPSWDPVCNVLYWVDIKRSAVFRFEPALGQTGHWPMSRQTGCVFPTTVDSRVVFADADGVGFLDHSSGQITRIADPEPHLPGNRFNDGKVDRAGRLWVGTMDDQYQKPTGSLYRLDTDLSLHRIDSGLICSNGIGWSPDNRTMYFTDSMIRTIWSYEFDLDTGEVGERRIFARLADSDGVPDGLTVDAEGFVWSAIWDGWRLIRYAPDGSIDKEIRMPVQRPTSCMFGGPAFRTLYVTSACADLSGESLRKGPLAGALFALEVSVAGLPETPFAVQNWGIAQPSGAKAP